MTRPSIIEVVDHILGDWFRGPTWLTWKAVLKAAFALKMNAKEIARFRAVAERDPPLAPVRELVAIAGRRAGKDSIASAIAVYAALGDYTALLRPGEFATVLCLACDRDQASIILRYIKSYFARVPALAAMVTRDTLEGLELSNNVEIIVGTNDYRAVRGRTIVLAILDEAAFYSRDSATSSDKEVAAALTPSLATLAGSILVVISSPHMKSGLLYEKWERCYGRPDARTLVVRGGTRAFNEGFDQAVIDEDLALDPQRASAEWLAEWRADLNNFIDPEMIDALTERDVMARQPLEGVSYFAFADASSGRADSFTCAIAHRDGERIILDAVMEWKAPFNAAQVVGECADFLRSYSLSEVWGDKYAVGFTISIFSQNGIVYRENITKRRADGTAQILDRSAIYLSWLPLATSGRLVLLDLPKMKRQFVALERRAYPTGLDKIQHPNGQHDDVANAVAGAMVLAADNAAQVALWTRSALLVSGAGVPMPTRADLIYATVAAGPRRDAGVVFFARNRAYGVPLTIVDAVRAQLSPTLLRDALARVHELLNLCPASTALIFTSSSLATEAERQGLPGFIPAPAIFDAEANGLALAASVHIAAGRVKVATALLERSDHMPLGTLLDASAPDADQLSIALLAGIAIALDVGRDLERAA